MLVDFCVLLNLIPEVVHYHDSVSGERAKIDLPILAALPAYLTELVIFDVLVQKQLSLDGHLLALPLRVRGLIGPHLLRALGVPVAEAASHDGQVLAPLSFSRIQLESDLYLVHYN